MSFEGVKVNKLNTGGGTGASPIEMAVVLPVATADLPVGIVHYNPHLVLQPSDVSALGFTASYDANKLKLIYQQMRMFFKYAPEGRLQVIPVPDTKTISQLAVDANLLAAIRVVKDVQILAIAVQADVATVFASANDVQSMIDAFADEHRLIDEILLTGKGGNAAMAIADYPDMRSKDAPNVSVSIAQDPAVASLDAAYAKYADWGSVLGGLAVRKISENLGSVDIINKPDARKGDPNYTLTDDKTSTWLSANLSDGTKVNSLSAVSKKALTDKGYIYAGSFEGYDGVYFNGSPTCTDVNSDYAYIERNRVWNAAARLIRSTLLPKVKGKVKKDPTTGYIKTSTISDWTGLLNKALEKLQNADEISGFSVYIDPKQVLSESSPLSVKATVVHDDIVYEFSVDLGYSNII